MDKMLYTLWVGGVEVVDFYLDATKIKELYDEYVADGYDDVVIEAHPIH
jgi:hypothetical protein